MGFGDGIWGGDGCLVGLLGCGNVFLGVKKCRKYATVIIEGIDGHEWCLNAVAEGVLFHGTFGGIRTLNAPPYINICLFGYRHYIGVLENEWLVQRVLIRLVGVVTMTVFSKPPSFRRHRLLSLFQLQPPRIFQTAAVFLGLVYETETYKDALDTVS